MLSLIPDWIATTWVWENQQDLQRHYLPTCNIITTKPRSPNVVTIYHIVDFIFVSFIFSCISHGKKSFCKFPSDTLSTSGSIVLWQLYKSCSILLFNITMSCTSINYCRWFRLWSMVQLCDTYSWHCMWGLILSIFSTLYHKSISWKVYTYKT